MEQRQKRPNKFMYILAAVGAAAGLGNLWRFPMLSYEHGGSAFIIALIVVNLLLAFPIIMMETMIGQRYQNGGPKAFTKLKSGTAWVQWLPVIAITFVFMYYIPVMAQGLKYFFYSFTGNFLADPANYFTEHIIQTTSNISINGGFERVLGICLLVSFLAVIFSLKKGIKSLSSVIKYTATLPFILLIILGIRGVTLPGGVEGLKMLFIPDRSALLDIQLRQAAIGQGFFSASVAMGYFIYSGSHRDPYEEIPKSTLWILAGNFLTSMLAGIAVFSSIGFLAFQHGVPVSEAATGGSTLVFSVLPSAIAQMPFFKIGFMVILFLVILNLAITSIFGMTETIVNAFMDLKTKYVHEFKTMLWVLGIVFLGSLPFITRAGTYYIDITDHFVGGYIFMLIGFLELAVVFFAGKVDTIRQWVNETTTGGTVSAIKNEEIVDQPESIIPNKKGWQIGRWFNVLLMILPILLLLIFISALIEEFKIPYQGYPAKYLIIFGGIPLLLVFITSLLLGRLEIKPDSFTQLPLTTINKIKHWVSEYTFHLFNQKED